jgi:putative peptidoglycan lipid II flippase
MVREFDKKTINSIEKECMRLINSIATLGFYTILSRIMGFVRDVLIASVLGAGPVADAFYVAFRFPNFFRRLFGEGAFNAAFVPTFSQYLTKEGEEPARIVASDILSMLSIVLLVLVIVVELTAPWLMQVIAPGFIATPERLELTIEFTRIMFPYVLFVCIAALYTGVLNTIHRFAVGAAAPILLNILMVIAMLFFDNYLSTPGHVLSWFVLIAGVGQAYWLHRSCVQNNFYLPFHWPRLTPPVKKVMKLMVPGAFAAGVIQLNIMVGIVFLSFLPTGAISYFFYADRLNQLPLSLVGIAISTALLPTLARHLAAGHHLTAHYTQNRAMEFSLFLILPASVALLVLSEPMIQVLFERNQFTHDSTIQTARILSAFALGLPAYVLVKIFSTSFFARHDTKTPLVAAVLAVITNLVFNFVLIAPFEHVGIALATSIASWVNAGWLIYQLQKQRYFMADRRLTNMVPRIVAATAFMGLILESCRAEFQPLLNGSEFTRAVALSALVTIGMAAYFAASFLFRSIDMKDLRLYLTRRQPKKAEL